MDQPVAHHPVLLDETVNLLEPGPGHVVVDATLGSGGHAESLLEAIAPDGRLIGIDRDPQALKLAGVRLARFGDAFLALRGDHKDLRLLLERNGISEIDRIVFDLGLSSMQVDDPDRGFSFTSDGPLDMRMDSDSGQTAADLVATLAEDDLRRVLWRYGEERRARAIARAIVREREKAPIERTAQLARLVERAAGPAARRFKIHPATRTFQALRIVVNGEIDSLEAAITDAIDVLRPGGRIGVISFHSLEDRIVKHTFRALTPRCTCPPRLPVCVCEKKGVVRVVTRKPVGPSPDEIDRNRRSRSAKLRIAEKL